MENLLFLPDFIACHGSHEHMSIKANRKNGGRVPPFDLFVCHLLHFPSTCEFEKCVKSAQAVVALNTLKISGSIFCYSLLPLLTVDISVAENIFGQCDVAPLLRQIDYYVAP